MYDFGKRGLYPFESHNQNGGGYGKPGEVFDAPVSEGVVRVGLLSCHFKADKWTENTKLIIVKSRDMLIAFMVDEVSEIVEIDDSEFHPIPKVVECEETSYIESVIQVKERLIVILNLDGILTEIEQKKLQNLIEEHQ